MNPPVYQYCQRCLAANALGQDFCTRCGTRLMIIVEPSAARFEATEATISSDEHLLERISAVENRITRLTERLERSLDLLLRQAQNSYFDRSLVKALIDLLTADGLVNHERLEQLWNQRCNDDAAAQEESVHRDELRTRILSRATGPDRAAFEKLVNEGFLLIEDSQTSRGIEVLKRAAESSAANSDLVLFIGEHFFRCGKTKIARAYLEKAHLAAPDNVHISLLLGLTCADEGEVELAKKLLNEVTKSGGPSFAGHYGLGWLFVAEKKWRKALTEFKQALNSKPSPEAHYVLACFYYEIERDELAIRHLRKATEMDPTYSEAFHLLALIYERDGQQELAAEALAQATSLVTSDQKARITPLFQGSPRRSRRLMAGTGKRFAELLREDALRSFSGN